MRLPESYVEEGANIKDKEEARREHDARYECTAITQRVGSVSPKEAYDRDHDDVTARVLHDIIRLLPVLVVVVVYVRRGEDVEWGAKMFND